MNDLSATERCVKCGLCLPYCPTFALTGNEADSPRGRISLMQLLERPDREWSPGVFKHLDQCLLCHACEAMCPSQVPFDQLMDSARERLEPHRRRSARARLMQSFGLGLLTSKTGRRLGGVLLGACRGLGLQRLSDLPGVPGSLRRLVQLLPAPPERVNRGRGKPVPAEHGVSPPARGHVSLFTGCTGELFDNDTLQASRRLLERLGYRVSIPSGQGCCGALHQHSGKPGTARQLAAANLDAFGGGGDPVLTFATGCAAQLLGYRTHYPQAEDFVQRVKEIVDFLATDTGSPLQFEPMHATVAVYIPCTQRHVLKQQQTLLTTLAQVPGLQTLTVNPDGGCCGAAGSYMLTQPTLSGRLGDAMVERVINSRASILLTTNIGCSLQLRAGLKRRGVDIRVMHPVVLLESLLIDS